MRNQRCLLVASIVAGILVPLLGCAADGGGSPAPSSPGSRAPAGWGGLVEEDLPPPEPLQGLASVPTPSVSATPSRAMTAAERTVIERAWALFRRGDAGWPAARDEWRALGPAPEALLAAELYRAMVSSRAAGATHLVAPARKELVLLGEAAVPVLVRGLATRAVRRSDGEEVRIGMDVLHDAAETLSLIGAPAVPGLVDIARCGEPLLVREALFALGNIADARARDVLLGLAKDEDEATRAAAVLALRHYKDPAVGNALVAALRDPEALVVERAAESLATRGERDVLPGVIEVLEQAKARDFFLAQRAAVWTLQRLTGEKLGDDPAAWRAWARSQER